MQGGWVGEEMKNYREALPEKKSLIKLLVLKTEINNTKFD